MHTPLLPSLAIATLVLAAGAHAAPPIATDTARVTRSAEGPAADHAADELRSPQAFLTTERSLAEVATKPRAAMVKGMQSTASAVLGDSWIYDATATAFLDRDNDGYYRYLRVRFDADTIYTYSYVYAEIYISADGNAWEHLYSTKDFAVWGSDPDDDYEVETELVSGYSTALYDVLIELYDADTGVFLDEFGPNESPDFSLLPLEDASRDGALAPPPDSYSHGGGGAMSWLTLSGLLGALFLRRRRR
jgi:hypothetical protein